MERQNSGNQGDRRADGMRKRGSVRESMSEIFRKARSSFVRSDGNRGASVEKLRGASGCEFEGEGMIHRGVEGGFCGGCFGSNPLVDRYLVIKGPFCFVFVKEDAASPQYAIKLFGLVADKPTHHSHRWMVLLRQGAVGDVQYELSFTEETTAQTFVAVVQQQASVAATEETRKRLGHEHLLTKRASLRFAETVAASKEKNQPDKPISREEILDANMAAGMGGPL